jgi:hypothetical protein
MIVGWGAGEYVPSVGKFLVKDQDRHGWTQVYFAGYGWVDIEMTPGRGEPERGLNYSVVPAPGAGGPAAVGSAEESPDFQQADIDDVERLAREALEALARQRAAEGAADPGRSISMTPFIILAIVAGAVLLLYGAWVLLHRGMKPGQRSYTKMVRAGRFLGVKRKAWQTPAEYAATIAAVAPGAADSAELIALGYERERYANGGAAASTENLSKHWHKVLVALLGYRIRLIAGARPGMSEERGRA